MLGQRLQLEAGYAQVTFDDGAKVIVQGPADFRIDSSGQGTLNFGKLTALVPRRAVGFRIETPTTDVVDLGTEFAVGVERSGKTEVHVKSGEVVVWEREPPAGRQSAAAKAGVHLYTEEAAKIGRSQVVSRLEARPSEFVWQIAPRLAPHERPSLPVVDSLALWMAADVLVSVDADGRVVAWRDIIAGDNQTEEDAMQPDELNRPRLVQDAIGGRSAVRFDGESSFLVTPPLESTAAQTLHFVLKRSYAEHKFGVMRQLINYNGPPYALDKSRDIRVLQIDDSEEPGVLWSRFFAGATSSGGVVTQIFNVGSVSTRRRVSPDVPIVLSYRYDPDANATTLWVNGRVEGVDGAPHWKSYTSRKVLGRHPRQDSFFRGDVAEVLIYNAALGDADNRRVIGYLSQRYDIACDSSE
ncbi:MAG: FecR domain-containing protein [Planctomycetota bacterium]